MTTPDPESRRRPAQRRALRFILLLSLIAMIGYLGISAYMVNQLTLTERRGIVNNPAADDMNFENVEFRSLPDNLLLRGWLFKADNDQGRIVIMVHGYNVARDDENTGMYSVAQGLLRRNFSVLLFDLRGSGQSEGDRFSLAWFEQQDVRAAVRFVQERGYQHIGLLGYSMGAAASLLAAADDSAVDAVVEDSAYASLMEVLDREVPKRSGLPGLFTPGIVLLAKLMYGIDAAAVRPAEAAARLAPRPLLVIHGGADTLIPVDSATRIWNARYGPGTPDPATYYIVAGAAHTQAFNTNRDTYLTKVGAFFEQYLK